jgi:endonuclease III
VRPNPVYFEILGFLRPFQPVAFALVRYFSFHNWLSLKLEDFAIMFKPTSKWIKSAHCVYWYLQEIGRTSSLPTTIPEMTRVFMIQKKSAVLILQCIYQQPLGIPVDRHLYSAFHSLGWVHQNVGGSPRCLSESDVSYIIEEIIPSHEWHFVNDAIAGLRQLYRCTRASGFFESLLKEKLSYDDYLFIHKLCI